MRFRTSFPEAQNSIHAVKQAERKHPVFWGVTYTKETILLPQRPSRTDEGNRHPNRTFYDMGENRRHTWGRSEDGGGESLAYFLKDGIAISGHKTGWPGHLDSCFLFLKHYVKALPPDLSVLILTGSARHTAGKRCMLVHEGCRSGRYEHFRANRHLAW